MEENYYLCRWSRSAAGWRLGIKDRPKIKGRGESYEEAEASLIEAIMDADDVMFVSLEFDKPLPKSVFEQKYTTPELYRLCGDDRFDVEDPDPVPVIKGRLLDLTSPFYDQELCGTCRQTKGKRTRIPFTLWHAPKYDGGFGGFGGAGPIHKIFSQEFLDLLTTEELSSLDFLPTKRSTGRKKFFELMGPVGPPPVAVKDLEISGWECDQCGTKHFGYFLKESYINLFIAEADLPDPLPSVFTISKGVEIDLVVTAARWKELSGKKGTRGILSHPLGVVKNAEVIRDPDLSGVRRRFGSST